MVIWLNDGTQHFIVKQEDIQEIIVERLGKDCGAYIQELIDESDYISESITADIACYESSLESNNDCFRDLLNNLTKLEGIIKNPRVIKSQALRIIEQMEREINNQF